MLFLLHEHSYVDVMFRHVRALGEFVPSERPWHALLFHFFIIKEYVAHHVCDFEDADTCGWQVTVETAEGEWRIAQADSVPFPAPGMDFSPGTSTGYYTLTLPCRRTS